MERNLSYHQELGEILPLGKTFGEYLEEAANEVPDKIAMLYKDQKISFSEFNQKVDHIALGLIYLGFRRGDVIGLSLPDVPEYSLMYFACAKIGVATTPISPRYRSKEFELMLGHSEAKGVLIPSIWKDFNYIEMIQQLKPKLPKLQTIFVYGDTSSDMKLRDDFVWLSSFMEKNWSENYSGDYLHEVFLKENSVQPDDVLEIAYTSGTTGIPKGAIHSHNTRVAAAILMNEGWGARKDDIFLVCAPLAHASGNAHGQNAGIIGQFTLVYMEVFEPEKALQEIERNHVTIVQGVASMYIAMMNHPNFSKYNVSTVRGLWCGGAPTPAAVARKMTEMFGGAQYLYGYGTTETGGTHVTTPGTPVEYGAEHEGIGHRSMETKIVDSSNRIVPIGEVGEVCMRGPMCMLGYYKNQEATKNAFDEARWFHTGDLAVMEEDGFIHIVGRLKDMIVRGGENIYASEIEEVLFTHPDIAEAYVVGYPDEYLGERICAFIRPKQEDITFTRESLLSFFEGKIAKHKVPDRVVVTYEFPMTPSGKIKKIELRERLIRELS